MRRKNATNCMLISNSSKHELHKIKDTFNDPRKYNKAYLEKSHEDQEIFLQNKRKKNNEKIEKIEKNGRNNSNSSKIGSSFTFDKCLNLFANSELYSFLEEDIKIRKDPEKLKQLNIEV
jgi:hypothetical protein